MKTKGEIEAAIGEEISRFEQDYMGQGPKDILVHLIDNLLLFAFVGSWRRPNSRWPKHSGRKRSGFAQAVRSQLIETTRPVMQAMVEKVTGVKVVTMHHDISTEIGEEVILFTLARSPDLCEAK